jgi:hypothetical protein
VNSKFAIPGDPQNSPYRLIVCAPIWLLAFLCAYVRALRRATGIE